MAQPSRKHKRKIVSKFKNENQSTPGHMGENHE